MPAGWCKKLVQALDKDALKAVSLSCKAGFELVVRTAKKVGLHLQCPSDLSDYAWKRQLKTASRGLRLRAVSDGASLIVGPFTEAAMTAVWIVARPVLPKQT